MTRRDLLILAGLASVSDCMRVRSERKVAVLGAGVAGLAAAAELGPGTVVFEARDRVGGRLYTVQEAGAQLDLGAAWIHNAGPDHPTGSILAAAGARFVPTDWDSMPLFAAGSRVPQPVLRRAELAVAELLERFGTRGQVRGAEVADAVRALPEPERDLVAFLMSAAFDLEFGVPMEQLVVDWTEEDWGADHQVVGGYGQLSERLVAQLPDGVDLRLGQPVEQVRWDEHGVEVDGEPFDAAVVTVPLGVLQAGRIRFDPALPQAKLAAIHGLGWGHFEKTFFVFAERFWGEEDAFGFLDGPGVSVADFTEVARQPCLVGMFVGPGSDAVVEEHRKLLQAAFPGWIEPLYAGRTDWAGDPWSLGSYSAPISEDAGRLRGQLAAPCGRLFWAGEATDAEAPSTVHGAYASGRAAARAILTHLA